MEPGKSHPELRGMVNMGSEIEDDMALQGPETLSTLNRLAHIVFLSPPAIPSSPLTEAEAESQLGQDSNPSPLPFPRASMKPLFSVLVSCLALLGARSKDSMNPLSGKRVYGKVISSPEWGLEVFRT